MTEKFNLSWNPHYDFNDPASQREIAVVEFYQIENDSANYSRGDVIDSPWGSNQVIDVKHEGDVEICTKRIVVKPGFMLSLQRHRARAEIWAVEEGVLTVISNGKRHEVPAGQSIDLPKGAVHCMINTSDAPVTVVETQTGLCREKDNIRLLDFNNRPTYPLTSETEYASAKLYAEIQAELHARRGLGVPPHESWQK